MIEIKVNKNCAQPTALERLTSGSVGVKIKFTFSAAWDGLLKNACFVNGIDDNLPSKPIHNNEVEIPHEALARSGTSLRVGVYGENVEGTIVIPTVYANIGPVWSGAVMNGRPPLPPTPGWAEQMEEDVNKAVEDSTSALNKATDVENRAGRGEFDGATFTPASSAITEGIGGHKISWTNDKGKPNPSAVDLLNGVTFTPAISAITHGHKLSFINNGNLTNPDPANIMDGKSAYELALEHGFTGTEAEWIDFIEANGQEAQDAAGEAALSEQNAGTSETNAANSATKSESWAVGGTNSRTGEDTNNSKYFAEQSEAQKNDAVTAKNGAETAKGDAVTAKNEAETAKTGADASAKEAKSWAIGGTNSREGENSDNSKYYSEQASTSAGTASTKAGEAAASAAEAQGYASQINPDNFANALRETLTGSVIATDMVSPIEHNVSCQVESANKISFPYIETDKEENGITWTVNADGSVTANGTATGNSYFQFTNAVSVSANSFLSGAPLVNGCQIQFWVMGDAAATKTDSGAGVQIPSQSECDQIYAVVRGGTTVDNVIFPPMLNTGNSAKPFVKGVSELTAVNVTRCGRNIVDLSETITPSQGVSATRVQSNCYDLSGVSTGTGSLTLIGNYKVLAGTYTISATNLPEGSKLALKSITDYSYTLRTDTKPSGDVATGNYIITLDFDAGIDFTGVQIKCQFEVGAEANSYESYNGQNYTPAADGTVEGMKSASSDMTILSDTAGVNIEATYNQDTNKVIQKLVNRIADLEAAQTI